MMMMMMMSGLQHSCYCTAERSRWMAAGSADGAVRSRRLLGDEFLGRARLGCEGAAVVVGECTQCVQFRLADAT